MSVQYVSIMATNAWKVGEKTRCEMLCPLKLLHKTRRLSVKVKFSLFLAELQQTVWAAQSVHLQMADAFTAAVLDRRSCCNYPMGRRPQRTH